MDPTNIRAVIASEFSHRTVPAIFINGAFTASVGVETWRLSGAATCAASAPARARGEGAIAQEDVRPCAVRPKPRAPVGAVALSEGGA